MHNLEFIAFLKNKGGRNMPILVLYEISIAILAFVAGTSFMYWIDNPKNKRINFLRFVLYVIGFCISFVFLWIYQSTY